VANPARCIWSSGATPSISSRPPDKDVYALDSTCDSAAATWFARPPSGVVLTGIGDETGGGVEVHSRRRRPNGFVQDLAIASSPVTARTRPLLSRGGGGPGDHVASRNGSAPDSRSAVRRKPLKALATLDSGPLLRDEGLVFLAGSKREKKGSGTVPLRSADRCIHIIRVEKIGYRSGDGRRVGRARTSRVRHCPCSRLASVLCRPGGGGSPGRGYTIAVTLRRRPLVGCLVDRSGLRRCRRARLLSLFQWSFWTDSPRCGARGARQARRTSVSSLATAVLEPLGRPTPHAARRAKGVPRSPPPPRASRIDTRHGADVLPGFRPACRACEGPAATRPSADVQKSWRSCSPLFRQ